MIPLIMCIVACLYAFNIQNFQQVTKTKYAEITHEFNSLYTELIAEEHTMHQQLSTEWTRIYQSPINQLHSNLFTNWVAQHSKQYTSISEHLQKFETFIENHHIITNHNVNNDWKMGHNQFSDMTKLEFLSRMTYRDNSSKNTDNTYKNNHDNTYTNNHYTLGVSDSIDWVTKGMVTSVKNQGDCGLCWAFATMSVVETTYAQQHKQSPTSFSVQHVLNCKSDSCDGGDIKTGIDVVNEFGLVKWDEYTGKGNSSKCKTNEANMITPIHQYKYIDIDNSKSSMIRALNKGILFVGINAEHLQSYMGGIIDSNKCSDKESDHAVVVVGYGTTYKGTDYYKVKNSWGTKWGEDGYFRLSMKGNVCNLQQSASIISIV